MIRFEEILEVPYGSQQFRYSGTLRNERIFKMNEIIYFVYDGNKIAKGEIIGIEKTISDNPEYKYKVMLPERLVADCCNYRWGKPNEYMKTHIFYCNNLFKSKEQALESCISATKWDYERKMQEIKRYFDVLEEQENNLTK